MNFRKTLFGALEKLRLLLDLIGRRPAVLLNRQEVLHRLGLGATASLYRYIDLYGFPKGRQVGASIRWVESEVEAWIRSRPQVSQPAHRSRAKTRPSDDFPASSDRA
jgi:predicted DNA-binding transcriptional regulator AlpA